VALLDDLVLLLVESGTAIWRVSQRQRERALRPSGFRSMQAEPAREGQNASLSWLVAAGNVLQKQLAQFFLRVFLADGGDIVPDESAFSANHQSQGDPFGFIVVRTVQEIGGSQPGAKA